ncbi:wd40 repeat-like protein [Diplodia corticola]|uniref:Wd40 repeat-like protein n=1 Tax=Diplodia corticola TaxID=236234 RepID=A0A1J9QVU5_9PEZI|nr:wd40 repeat-like protein [Diplodia corticola]OJD32536.1 wd40 repeat-like protein [Diplodia corticola]
MASIKSIRSLTLDIPPSCIEFVPGHPELFVVGTYYLEKKQDEEATAESTNGQPQQRTGSLLLFRLDGDEVTLKHTLSTPFAIFDIHFAPPSTAASTLPLLGAATSTGSLALYQVSASTLSIATLSVLQIFPTTSLITHFTWHPSIPSLAALALSSGSIYLCDTAASNTDPIDDGDTTPTAAYLHAHSLEAWFVAFTPDGTGLLSGGDDSTLASLALPFLPSSTTTTSSSTTSPPPSAQKLLLLSAIADDHPPPPQWQDRRTHQAGVTALLPLSPPPPPSNQDKKKEPPLLLLTGSYDDRIRLLALPTPASSFRRPKLLAELDLGGGVWRLKDITDITAVPAHDTGRTGSEGRARRARREYIILASCMHAGARVLRLEGRRASAEEEEEGGEGGDEGEGESEDEEDLEWSFDVLAAFEEHESMNYASDVRPGGVEGGKGRGTVVSTSFYDRLLAVWRW